MDKFITLMRLYSVQVLAILAAINTAIATQPQVPWWVTLGVNVLGLVVGMIVRDIPQPAVAMKLQALRAPDEEG